MSNSKPVGKRSLNKKDIKQELNRMKTESMQRLLKENNFTELIKRKINARQMKIRQLHYDFIINAKKQGFTVKELKDLGFKIVDILKAGYNLKEMRLRGFTAEEMHNSLKPAEMMLEAGYSRYQILKAGCFVNDLKEAKFTAKELLSTGRYNARDLVIGGYSVTEVFNSLSEKLKNEYPEEYLTKIQKHIKNIVSNSHLDIYGSENQKGNSTYFKRYYSVRDAANYGFEIRGILEMAYPLDNVLDVFHKDAFYARNIGTNYLIRAGCCSMDDIKNAYPRLKFIDLVATDDWQNFEFERLGAHFKSRAVDAKLYLSRIPNATTKRLKKEFRQKKEFKEIKRIFPYTSDKESVP